MSGCRSGPLLWPCYLSKLYPVAAAGILLWSRVRLWCWYVRRASGFWGLVGISLIIGVLDVVYMQEQICVFIYFA